MRRELVAVASFTALVTACAEVETPEPDGQDGHPHIQLMTGELRPAATPPASVNLLQYYGGPVISNVKVVQVNWNGSIDPTIKNGMGGFYSAVTASEYFDWLDGDYATTRNANAGSHNGMAGTQQHIGRGTFNGQFTLTGTSTSGTIFDSAIQQALSSNISSGNLPQPDANTIYMVQFPPHTLIDDGAGDQSCPGSALNLFCAYHSTMVVGSLHVKYGVLPDVSVDCNSGCGSNATYFNNGTSVASHELIEAVTDADVGLVTGNSYDYPAAWGGSQGEIGDICNATQGTIAALQPDGSHYVVQKEYDNVTGNCIVTKTTTNDFSIGPASPASVTVAQGGMATASIPTALVSGSAQSIALSASGQPAGVTAGFSPSSVTAGSSSTLTLTVGSSATPGTYTITVTGTASSGTHATTVSLAVTGPPSNGITNGGFETGNLSGWTVAGSASASTTAHTGSFSALVGSTSPSTDSSISQTFSVPTGQTQLSFWYQITCPDTLTYDWATATLTDTTAGTTSTLLAPTCTNDGTWHNVTASVVAGHAYTLKLASHDDNYTGDATYTRYDDVTLGGTAANDFSISLSPSSRQVAAGATTTFAVNLAVTSGAAQTVTLAVANLPTGVTGSFNPATVTGNGSSTLTLTAAGTAPAVTNASFTVTGTATSGSRSASATLTVTPPTSNDFSVGPASPASVSAAQGGSATTSIPTAVTSGSAQSVAFSASGQPAGVTAAFSPSSVTAGSSSTLTLTVGSSATPGTYTITVTGTGSSATHTTTVSLTVTGTTGSGITNGGFESGNLNGWAVAGSASASTTAHSGSFSALVGSTSPSTDSSISQTFTVASGQNQLSFWYQITCPDTITYDWATATLTDNTTGVTTTVLPPACTNDGSWHTVSASVVAGHSYTLKLASHDDNYAGDATYTRYDDVTLSAAAASPLVNGGFEAGSLSGWTTSGTAAAISGSAHGGSYAARVGSTSPSGTSSIAQTFTAPSGVSTISFWYEMSCPDTVTYDWATATLRDNTAGTTTTLLANTCQTSSSYTLVSGSVTAGHSYTLTLTSHDDNYAGDPTYTLYDDVSLQ
jgi:hypothetical protein